VWNAGQRRRFGELLKFRFELSCALGGQGVVVGHSTRGRWRMVIGDGRLWICMMVDQQKRRSRGRIRPRSRLNFMPHGIIGPR